MLKKTKKSLAPEEKQVWQPNALEESRTPRRVHSVQTPDRSGLKIWFTKKCVFYGGGATTGTLQEYIQTESGIAREATMGLGKSKNFVVPTLGKSKTTALLNQNNNSKGDGTDQKVHPE